MFEWHFAIRGPKGTDFEGGRYHGKILLPAEYPFKPPNIVFLTPNGRWETKTKICLSMSAYHPEDWQPAWGIRTMLEALISFMPSPSDGALGAIDCTPEQRRRLALESQSYSHPLMPPLPEEGSCAYKPSQEAAEAISQMRFQANKAEAEDGSDQLEGASSEATTSRVAEDVADRGVELVTPRVAENAPAVVAAVEEERPRVPPVVAAAPVAQTVNLTTSVQLPSDRVDDALRIASWLVLLGILVLAYRKLLLTFAPEL